MPSKRLKIFQKIAQTTTTPTTTSTTPAPTTVPGSPKPVTVDSYFPTFAAAWGTNYKGPTDELLALINETIYVLSVGQFDLEFLRANSFVVDTTKYPDAFLMSVVVFAKYMYQIMLNSGKPFKTQVQNKKEIIQNLIKYISTNSKIPDSLSNSFPQSFLQSKIGNFKPKVISILTQMNAIS